MKDVDRGMVKYAPYQSLVEQSFALARMRQSKSLVEKKLISVDEAEQINEILTQYDGEVVRVGYWRRGQVFMEEGTIDHIDCVERSLWINGIRIFLTELQSLERK